MKRCPICKETKDVTNFWIRTKSKDGLSYACKGCLNKIRRDKRYAISLPKKLLKINRKDKTCTVCKETKALAEFSDHHLTLDGKGTQCRSCRNMYRKNISGPKIKARANSFKLRLINSMGGKCSSCGISPSEEWPLCCFDFHHNGGKDFPMSRLIPKAFSEEVALKITEEAKKCVILCANCHRKHHWGASSN
jgi:hypothetical protein